MAMFEWRKFNFFDLKEDADNGKVAKVLQEANITSVTNGYNQIVFCDSNGFIHVFPKTWDSITFHGHDGLIPFCEMSRQNNLLVTLGLEENGTTPTIKVWNLVKLTQNGAPCIRTVKTTIQKPTALGVSESGQYMAVGFDRGSISLYKGDIGKDKSKIPKSLSAGTTSITGIAFNNVGKIVQMFVCCNSGVLVYHIQNRDKETKIILDTMNEPTRCCGIQKGQGSIESTFMVGRDDAVYCYTSDGKGPCYALDGEKSIIQWFRSHLLTVSKPNTNALPSQKNSLFTVIDVQNKFIVFSMSLDSVIAICVEFGTCYLVTKNKKIYHLDEKDLQSKLSLLFKKNLYDIAVRIAKNNQYDSEGLAEIFRQYGDHLYSKGDYGGAVDQYNKTIGYVEPSYVIRRFLDSRHISYLTDYLQAIHNKGNATADHTTLLLNCFTRLDRTDQLKEFLKNDQNPDILFDLDVAIKVCRTASIDYALLLAKHNQKHDFVISILTEDMKLFKEAIEYISNLTFFDAERIIKIYGTILIENSPIETTELLKKLCTDYKTSMTSNNNDNKNDLFPTYNSPMFMDRGNPEEFMHLFMKSDDRLIDFLEHLISNLSNCTQLVYNTLIEHYLQRWTNEKHFEERLMEILRNYGDSYDKNHTLIMCRTYEFWPGIMFLYEEDKLYHLVVRYHLRNRDYNNLLSTCKRLGPNQSSLWLQALTGLRNDKQAPPNLLAQVLHVISQEKLQSPLQVLNCIAIESGPNLSSVREYFMQVFQKEKQSTKQEEDMVEKYRKDSIFLKNHLKRLREDSIEFRGTTCDTCQQALSQPTFYFLCQHSFHQDCVRGYSDNDKDCPVCHTKNIQLLDALRAQHESRGQHESFHNRLIRSTEPFSVVSDSFCRGLFNKIVIFKESEKEAIKVSDTVIKPTGQTINKPNVTAAAASVNNYGYGAESKMRINEVRSQPNKIPMSEGRMRIQERNDTIYSSSLEANIIKSSQQTPTNPTNITREKIQNFKPPIKKQQTNSITKSLTNKTTNANPFGDDDDDVNVAYDDTLNPFAKDEEIVKSSLDDYDNNLNPFA